MLVVSAVVILDRLRSIEGAGPEKVNLGFVLLLLVVGVVITVLTGGFIGRAVKKGERQAEDARQFAASVVETVREPLIVLSGDLRVVRANRSFYETFKVRPDETENRLVYELGNNQWDIPALRTLLEEILPQNTEFHDYNVDHDFPGVGRRIMLLNARRIHQQDDRTQLILLAIEDVSERRRAEQLVEDAKTYAEAVVETVREPLIVLDGDLRVVQANRSFYQFFRVTPEETENRLLYELGNGQWNIPKLRTLLEEVLPQHTEVHDFDVEHNFLGIGLRIMRLNARRLRRQGNNVTLFLLAIEDTTEQRRAERVVEAARNYAESIVDTVRKPLVILDGGLRVKSANRSFCQTFHVTPEETANRLIYDLGNRQWDIPALRTLLEEVLPQKTVFNDYEVDHVFPGIGRRIMLLNARRLDRGPDATTLILLAIEDITEREIAERLLRENRELLRVTLGSIGDAVITIDLRGRVASLNAVGESLTGWKNDEATGVPLEQVFRIVNESTRQTVENPAAKALRDGVIVGLANHTVLIAKDGTERPIDDSAAPIRDEQGHVFGCVLVFRDVADQRRAERAVKESEARYRAIGETIDFGVWMCDTGGRNTHVSKPFLRLVGRTQEQITGTGWFDLVHPAEVEKLVEAWKECIRTDGVWDREFRIKGVDGVWHYLLGRGVPVRNDEDRVLGWVGINLDIDRLKMAEQALRDGDRRKDEFLATLAHELRNPLAPVRNAVQLLNMTGATAPELQRARDVIDRQMQAMTRLIDDLMDISRISSNKLALSKERIELTKVVAGAVETSRPLIEQQGHELTVTLPPEPIIFDADLTRLTQVFLNLLNNAAKYTKPGGRIDLRAERQGSDVVVSVQDTGIGIAADILPTVFEMFSQVEGSLSRSQGGLGIGLCLVKRLVEMHGGSIEAQSEGPGKGSTFVVRLPMVLEQRHVPKTGDDTEEATPSSTLRLLVVDDNRDAADSLAEVLKLMGNNVRTAYDGQEAVQAAGEFRPRVVLCDIGLPKLNGYEVCRRIREQPWGTNMLLIAVTGWGQDNDKRQSKEAGFDRHMVKPVDPQSLMKLLAGLPDIAPSGLPQQTLSSPDPTPLWADGL